MKLFKVLFIILSFNASLAFGMDMTESSCVPSDARFLSNSEACSSFGVQLVAAGFTIGNFATLGVQLIEYILLRDDNQFPSQDYINEHPIEWWKKKKKLKWCLINLPLALSLCSNGALLINGCNNQLLHIISRHAFSNALISGVGFMNCIGFAHDGVCAKNAQKPQIILTSQININDELPVGNCPICFDKLGSDCINPCKTPDHVYCRTCLTKWFVRINKGKRNIKDMVFKCILCTQDIAEGNESVQVVVDTIPKPTLQQIAKSMIDVKGIIALFFIVGLTYNLKLLMGSLS